MRIAALFVLAATLMPAHAAEQGPLGMQISAAQVAARSGSRNIRDIEAIHERMQASINCLVGPKHPDFDPGVRNPCALTGNGVIPDTPDAAKKARYMEAVAKLKAVKLMDERGPAMEAALAAADLIVAISEQ